MSDKPVHKWKLPVLILAAASAIIILLQLTKPTPPTVDSKEKAWLVDTETIVIGANEPHMTLLGSVQSPFDSVLSAVIQADVAAVPVREGDQVRQGQVLVELDQREIDSRVRQRKADVEELQASIAAEKNRFAADQRSLNEELRLLKVAEEALARQARLKSSNLVAQERLEQAESQVAQRALSVSARQQAIDDHPNRLKQLNARLSRAQARLEDALLDQERSTIGAPFAGVITRVNVAPGDRVQVGQAIVGIYDIQQTEIRAQLPSRHLSIVSQALSNKNPVHAEVDYFGQAIAAKLTRIAGVSNANAGGVDVFFSPTDTQNQSLILNSAVRINVALPALENTFTLPVSAVYGTDRVYKVVDDRIQAMSVEILGNQLDGNKRTRVIIKADHLNAGDTLITTQLPNAISGLKVEVRGSNP